MLAASVFRRRTRQQTRRKASINRSYPFVPVSPIAALSGEHWVVTDLVELATYNAR